MLSPGRRDTSRGRATSAANRNPRTTRAATPPAPARRSTSGLIQLRCRRGHRTIADTGNLPPAGTDPAGTDTANIVTGRERGRDLPPGPDIKKCPGRDLCQEAIPTQGGVGFKKCIMEEDRWMMMKFLSVQPAHHPVLIQMTPMPISFHPGGPMEVSGSPTCQMTGSPCLTVTWEAAGASV